MRYLVVPSGSAIDSFEVAIIDLLKKLEQDEEREKATLEQLRDMMRSLRRGGKLSKADIMFIDTLTMKGRGRINNRQ